MEEIEIWKDIGGYDGIYQVSNFGNIKSLDRIDGRGWRRKSKAMTQYMRKTGYMHVGLMRDGKQTSFCVHRIVAEAHILNPYNLEDVNHKDEVKHNNASSNLEWSTTRANINYSVNKKLKVNIPELISIKDHKNGDLDVT